MKRAMTVFLLGCVALGSAQAQLKIDFGTATSPVESGYQAYTATHEVANTFTPQSFEAFGTAITVALTWSSSPANTAMQMFGTERPADGRWAYTGEHRDLIQDWTGTDGRVTNASPLVLTLSGLPMGTYSWLSYHHDGIDQTGVFSVTVKDASGTRTTEDVQITNSAGGDNITDFASISTFTTEFTSNGKDDVAFEFTITSSTTNLATAFFVMNAFEIELLTALDSAHNPSPSDGQTDVLRDGVLSWRPGVYAAAHDVYLGTTLEDVNDASRANPLDVLAKQAHDANSFDPGRLEFGTTYYWRVDEVNGTPDNTIFKGSIWSFTVEPVSYEVTGVTATASGSGQASTGPEKTVDGSGLNANGEHGTTVEDGWVSAKGDPQWIQYELPDVCKLDKMLVWNSNQTLEELFGFGAKDVTIEYSPDGAAWTELGTFEFAQAPGAPDYTANTTVDFAGVVARFVKLTINSNWGGIFQQYGLSEVRFYSIPVLAREPKPAPDSTDVHPQVALSWRAGREAASHELSIDTDPNAVADGAVAPVTLTQPAYDFAADLGQTYYWKVVEVNQAEDPTSWASDVWSFSTADYVVVDDFESYTNESPKRVFQTWIDGAGFSADDSFPNGNPGNGSGSYAGYDPQLGDIMETAIIHGGGQSMPLYYGNDAAPRYSEAIRTFDPPQDWTKHGVTTLVLYFYGDLANSGAPVYLKINGTKVLYNNGAASTTTPLWKQWNIDLASVPAADIKNVTTLTIGVGDGSADGSGTILIDDIQLYRVAPPAPTEQLWIEAESATPTVPVPWVITDEPLASGGKYITTPSTTTGSTDNPPTTGVATYSFTVAGGAYRLWLRLGPLVGYDNDSLWVRIKDATIDPAGNAANPGWVRCNGLAGQAGAATWHLGPVWDDENGSVQVTFTLPAGNHTLEVGYREPAVALDAILITN
jgi:hypothetical protein